jgi:hypothetical protein
MRVRRPRRSTVVTLGAAVTLACGGLLVPTVSDSVSSYFFMPTAELEGTPGDAGFAYEDVAIPGADGQVLHGWYLPRPDGADTGALVLQVHGNAVNVSRQWQLAAGLVTRGHAVLAFDYGGFGRSPGRPSRRRALADVDAALRWARARAEGERLPLVVLGQSMGASLSLQALAEAEPAGVRALVVDAPFSTWHGVAAHALAGEGGVARLLDLGLRALLAGGGIQPVDAATRLRGDLPVLVVTGTEDRICPSSMARDVAAACGGALLELQGAPHVGMRGTSVDERVFDAMDAFYRAALTGRR